MRKKILVQQLRIGMFVDEVCGSWMSHPFWRASFMVQDAQQIAQLSIVKEVVIDTSKGLDVALALDMAGDSQIQGAGQAEPPAALHSIALPANESPLKDAQVATAPGAQAATPVSFEGEMARASRIVAQAGPAMKSMFLDARLGKAVNTEHCLPLVNDITESIARNPGAIVSLARLKTSDDYTYMHSVAVCALMVSLAKQLGLGEADTREAGLGGLVHDLGKAMTPLALLNKPGALSAAEYAVIKGHPEAGHRMLVEGKGVGEIPLDVCLHHHEKINGKGYPHGLQGEAISVFAKMGAVCDVYDAITSNRPYKSGWDPAESIQKMAQWAQDGQFDEGAFQAFVKSVGIYPTGSLVKLKSGRLGVVVEQGGQSLLRPVVRVFFSAKANEPLTPSLLDLGDDQATDQIVSRESVAAWGFQNLDRFWLPQP